MEIQTFGEEIRKIIKSKVKDSTEIMLREIVKSNDVCRLSIIIRETDSIIAPTIYLDNYFQEYINGSNLEEIAVEILNDYYKYLPKGNIDLDFFRDFDKAKDKLFVKLINKKKNSKYLKDVLNRDFLDLSVVIYYCFSCISDISATVTIKKEQLEMWDVTEDEIFEIALKNTKDKMGCVIEDIVPYLISTLCSETPSGNVFSNMDMMKDSGKMYYMTNISKHFGAVCMLYEDKLKEFANKCGSNLLIIPSSIHEIILVPDRNEFVVDQVNNIINEVNSCTLEEGEILSNHMYYFEYENGFRQII